MRIAYLDPVPEAAGLPLFLNELKKYAGKGTEVSYHTLSVGSDNYEYEVFEAYMMPHILNKVRELEEEGYDGCILGCFYDPALDAAKELCTRMVVVGAAQGAVTLVKQLSRRFSIMIPRDKNYTHMLNMVQRYADASDLASVRVLNIRVLDIQNNGITDLRMQEEMECAIKNDRAEAMVLACTMEVGKYIELQEKYSIPVIDPAVAGLKLAEYLIGCRDTCKWYTSNQGTYESPDRDELDSFTF